MARLKDFYKENVVSKLTEKFGYKNVMQVPKLVKVVINVGAGEARDNSKVINSILEDLGIITGQKAVVCTARRSVANFKVRKGMAVGAKVTLRGDRMYAFMDKLVSIALPRVRDFRGVNTNLDGRGNYTLGIREQLIFPEIVYDQVEKTRGFDVTFVTTAKTDEEGKALLKYLGMPFRA